MHKPHSVVLLALLAAFPAAAQPLTADQFEALTTGKTIDYMRGGQHLGTERYFPNRRVEWAFPGDECQMGRWYEAGELICFVYEGVDTPQCWRFEAGADGLVAQFENDPANPQVYGTAVTPKPLECIGPKVGV